MKRFTKLLHVMTLLLLMSSIGFAQTVIMPKATQDQKKTESFQAQEKTDLELIMRVKQSAEAMEATAIKTDKKALQQTLVQPNQINLSQAPVSASAKPGVYTTIESPKGVIYSQMIIGANGAKASQDFETAYDQYDCRGADDFTVPTGATWNVDIISWYGAYYNGAGPAAGFNIEFFNDNAGLPGTSVQYYANLPYVDNLGLFTANLPATLSLGAGTYWISIQARMDFAIGGQYGWQSHAAPMIAYESVWENPNGGFAPPATGWNLYSIMWPTDTDRDFCFELAEADPNDVGVVGFVSPVTGANLTATEVVTVNIQNFGSTPETNFNVSYSIGPFGVPVVELFTGTINPGQIVPFTFATTANLSVYGSYAFNACTQLSGDINPANDCFSKTISNFPPVPNDDCVDAILVGAGGYPETVNGTTEGAAISCPGVLDWRAAWYEVTLPHALNDMTVDFCGTPNVFGSVGVVYYFDCTDCNVYTIVDFNTWGDCGGGYNVPVSTYLNIPGPGTIRFPVFVGAVGDDGHPFTATFDVTASTPLPNDDFCDAISIIVDDPPIAGNNAGATVEAWELAGLCWGTPADNTVWYSFVAPASGDVRVNTDFVTGNDDTQLTLYEWTAGTCDNPTLVELGCGEDDGVTGSGFMAIITATGLTPATTYYVQVDGYGATIGDFLIEVTEITASAGCQYASQYPSGAVFVDAFTGLTTITTCNFAGEFSHLTNIQSGETYEFTMSDLGTGAYITVTDGPDLTGNILTYGPSPLTWTATSFDDLYVHWSLDEFCSTDFVCHVTTAQCLTCPTIPPPANDLCVNAEAVIAPYPKTVTGTTLGATVDCPGVLDWDAVWYTIDLPYAQNLVSIDLCMDNQPALNNTGIILTADCSCDPASFIFSTGTWTITDNCINGLEFLVAGPGTVYYPVLTDPKDDFTFDVDVIPFFEVSGTLSYAGPGAIPIDNSLVEVYDNTDPLLPVLLGTVPTDDFGLYSFLSLPGDYALYASTLKPRGGTNLADINLVVAHLLGTSLTGLPFLASDVNIDGLVTLADYNFLVSELLGLNPVWDAPDWLFENPAFTLSSDLVVDFQGLSSGDPDGSYAVPFGAFAPLGSTCADAYPVTAIPFNMTGMTTCGFGNDYSSANACGSSYMNGEDFVFEYTPAANITISIALTNTLGWTGVFVTEGCPDVGTCVNFAASSTGNPILNGVALTGGTTYYIIVSTWPTPDCTPFDIDIFVTPAGPANDVCAGATPIGEVTDLPFNTGTATASGVNPGCGGATNPIDLWYAYSPSITGTATIDLCGSTFDTRVAVYDACGGSVILCNDDFCGLQSSVTIPVTVGTTYYIQVGGYNAAAGAGDLTTSVVP